MKKLVFMSVLLLLMPVCIHAQMYFEDDFEDPKVTMEKWEIILGEWEVNDGIFQQVGSGDNWLVAMVSNEYWKKEWTEYTVEFRARNPVEGLDNSVNVVFRVQDPVPANWGERKGPNSHFYRWMANGYNNTLGLIGVYEPGAYERLAEGAYTLEIGEWYDIKLVVTEKNATAYINGEKFLETDDVRWTEGRVGIQVYNGPLDVDDLMIYGPGGASVEPAGKLPTKWGQIKGLY